MLLIRCPWCGLREETEFRHGGEPATMPTSDADAATWAHYLFFRSNPAGTLAEQWVHIHGCRRWFNIIRDTTSNVIAESYRVGERPSGR